MDRQIEIVDLLLKATIRINEAIKHRDIEMVKTTIEKRDILLEEYKALNGPDLEGAIKELSQKILVIDQENNDLLAKLVEDERLKINETSREKNVVKKKTSVAKKYVTAGYTVGEYSKFNEKT